MSSVFVSTIADAVKNTLNSICDDSTDGLESNAQFTKWCETKTMEDAYEDDLEVGGPGLASEKPEGSEVATGTLREGYLTRYIARTFAQKLIVTEEAMEDNKYPKVINAARRLKRSLYKTMDVDATNIMVRAWNTSYVGGDGQPLFSASHTLPNGGTFSNTLSVAQSPSVAALVSVTSAIRKMVGHDGQIEGYEPKQILCPTEQWGEWNAILGSSFTPTAGNFAEINVIKPLGLEVIPLKFWTTTTTNWCVITDCDNGINWRWRRKPKGRSWVDNDHEQMKYSISARWARGWSDPRCAYGSQA